MRTDLCLEALRLARMLAALAPGDAEVHGLQALLELQALAAARADDAARARPCCWRTRTAPAGTTC